MAKMQIHMFDRHILIGVGGPMNWRIGIELRGEAKQLTKDDRQAIALYAGNMLCGRLNGDNMTPLVTPGPGLVISNLNEEINKLKINGRKVS